MYAFIILVCLITIPDKCITIIEDPPLYYETVEECEKNMISKSTNLREQVSKNKEVEMFGQCIHFPNIKAT